MNNGILFYPYLTINLTLFPQLLAIWNVTLDYKYPAETICKKINIPDLILESLKFLDSRRWVFEIKRWTRFWSPVRSELIAVSLSLSSLR